MNSYDGNEPIESKHEVEEKDTTGPTAMFEGLATILVGLIGIGVVGAVILLILRLFVWLWPFS